MKADRPTYPSRCREGRPGERRGQGPADGECEGPTGAEPSRRRTGDCRGTRGPGRWVDQVQGQRIIPVTVHMGWRIADIRVWRSAVGPE